MNCPDFLSHITPVIATYNEAPNIERTLDALTWAKRIVIIDSHSDDETLELVARYPACVVYQRAFDTIAGQWAWALENCDLDSGWALALDADFVLTPEHVSEMAQLAPSKNTNGYVANFRYCINGAPLRSGIYPPRITLFRPECGRFWQDGHTQRLEVHGEIGQIAAPIMHDDRKSLRRWLSSQQGYAVREADKLLQNDGTVSGFAYRVRKLRVVAPFVVIAHCLLFRGGILEGKAGWFYALQRGYAELLLSLELLDRDIHGRNK